MAPSARAFALSPLTVLLLSIFLVEAHLAPSSTPTLTSTPTPLSYISSSPKTSPATPPSSSPKIQIQSQSQSQSLVTPHDVKSQMDKVIEGNMQMTMMKIEEFGQTLKKRLDDPETSTTAKECIQQCDEVYEAAKDDIKNSLQDIKDGDLFKANFDINSIATNVDTCQQCFEEMVGEDPEIKKFDDWVRFTADDCLTALDGVLT